MEATINVTTLAAEKISELLAEENKPQAGLRVFVQGGGCSGFQYGLMIEEGDAATDADQTIESNGIKLFIDPITWVDGWPVVNGGHGPSAASDVAPATG